MARQECDYYDNKEIPDTIIPNTAIHYMRKNGICTVWATGMTTNITDYQLPEEMESPGYLVCASIYSVNTWFQVNHRRLDTSGVGSSAPLYGVLTYPAVN